MGDLVREREREKKMQKPGRPLVGSFLVFLSNKECKNFEDFFGPFFCYMCFHFSTCYYNPKHKHNYNCNLQLQLRTYPSKNLFDKHTQFASSIFTLVDILPRLLGFENPNTNNNVFKGNIVFFDAGDNRAPCPHLTKIEGPTFNCKDEKNK